MIFILFTDIVWYDKNSVKEASPLSEAKKLQKDANIILKQTSRTFYIPITLLKSPLDQTVGSAYLCMRAVDEIEDHKELDTESKQHLLRVTSELRSEERRVGKGWRGG